ncbi:hypothetical protein WJX74_010208 [Apatococcus lobatus]|uniref:Peptidase S74 domain-containing protein n=1 Tax=Apatococcus lobatus TaxID=904363 RepID=A0AAW1Q790_9CHLO
MSTAIYSNPVGVLLQASNGAVTLSGQSVVVNGPATASGPVSLASTLAVTGTASFGGTLTANALTGSSGNVSGTMNVNTLAASTLSVSGNASVTGSCTFSALTGQTASFAGQASCGSLTAGATTLAATTIGRCTVSGATTLQGAAALAGGLTVTGGSSLQNVGVSGGLAVTAPATFSTAGTQPVQIVGTSTGTAYSELVMDRSAAGQNNTGSLRMAPGAGLQLTSNSLKALTVGCNDQQVSVTANRSGQTFAVRGDGQISASTEVLLDNGARAAGQTGLVGVDSSGLYLTSGTSSKALLVNPSGNVALTGNLIVPGSLQAAGASTFSSLNASSLSTASLTASAVSASRITGSGALALQGGDAAQTVTVTNVLSVNNIQAKAGAALALSGQDANLTTQVVGTVRVDSIGKRAASTVSIVDPVSVTTSLTCPLITLNGSPASNASQLSITNTDSTAASDAAVAFNRSAFNGAYTGSIGLRPNVGFFVQLGGALAISTDVASRTTTLGGGLSVGGAVTGSGALTVAGAVSSGGALTCGAGASVAGGLSVGGSPATVSLMNGTSTLSTLSADASFCYLRYIDPNGVIADRLKIDRTGAFSMNGPLSVSGALSCGAVSSTSLTGTSSNNTPAVTLQGLSTTMAQLYADSGGLRLRYYDSGNALQDRVTVDRSGNLAIASNLSLPGSVTASSASLSGALGVGGAATLTGAVSMLGAVAITGASPYALTMGPSSGAYASLAATSSACTLSVTDGTTLQNRLTVTQAGLVSVNALAVAGGLTCGGAVSSGNLAVSAATPSVTLGAYGRVLCDPQFMHLQVWDGSNAPTDRVTISTTGLVGVPNGITTGTLAIANDAGSAVQLRNGSGTAWGSVYADASTLRLRSADANGTLQDRLVAGQGGALTVAGTLSIAGGITSAAPLTVVSGTTAGAGAQFNLQAGSTVSSAVYSEQGFMALQVQNSSGTLVSRATLDTYGNVKLLGPTGVSGPVACTGTLTVSSQAPAIVLNNGSTAPFAQLSATSGQVVLAVTNGQNQLQTGIAWDTGANMTCPGALTVGAVSTTRLTSAGPLQGASALTLTDPTNGGFGASLTHTGANSTPQIVMSLADNTGAYSPQLTVTNSQVSTSSLSLANTLSVGGGATVGGALSVAGALSASSSLRATSQISLYADPSAGTANLYMTSSNGSTTNTQVISTPTYASFLQVTAGSGLTERMRFDNSTNVLFNASLIPNTSGLTIGTSAAKWNQIWSVNTPNTTSDARRKKDIAALAPAYGLDLVERLRPASYRWKDSACGEQTHWGLIAQEVAELVPEDASAVTRPDADFDEYALSYSDFVAPLVLAVQQLSARCRALEARSTAG